MKTAKPGFIFLPPTGLTAETAETRRGTQRGLSAFLREPPRSLRFQVFLHGRRWVGDMRIRLLKVFSEQEYEEHEEGRHG